MSSYLKESGQDTPIPKISLWTNGGHNSPKSLVQAIAIQLQYETDEDNSATDTGYNLHSYLLHSLVFITPSPEIESSML